MALQNKKSRSRKGMRRSGDRVAARRYLPLPRRTHRSPHSVCPNRGTYKGRQVIAKSENE